MYRWLFLIGLILAVVLASGSTESIYAWNGQGGGGHGYGGHGYSSYGYRGWGFSPWNLLIPPFPIPVPVPVPPFGCEP